MTVLFYIIFLFLFIYSAVLIWLAIGYLRTSQYSSKENTDHTSLSIIICARNEEKTIARCLKTIVQQEYDLKKIEIILINDASSDSTVLQAQAVLKNSGINYKIISNQSHKGKKQSIAYAMQFVNNDLIVLRDADTYTLSYTWLKCISDFYLENKPDLVIGPVAISDNSGSLWAIQAIENNVLLVLNAGSAFYKKAFLCNGANLIFTKSVYEKTNGYQGHINVSSGDDVLFLEDVKKIEGTKISFLKSKEAIVYTYPCFSFNALLFQKVRWAAKFKVNKNKLNLLMAFISFIVNLSWMFCLFFSFIVPENGNLGLIFVLFKLFIDFLLLFLASLFVKNRSLGWYILSIGFVYPVYTCIIAISSVFMKPKWK